MELLDLINKMESGDNLTIKSSEARYKSYKGKKEILIDAPFTTEDDFQIFISLLLKNSNYKSSSSLYKFIDPIKDIQIIYSGPPLSTEPTIFIRKLYRINVAISNSYLNSYAQNQL